MIPRETMRVVAPAGGWLASSEIIRAAVADSESADASTGRKSKPLPNALGKGDCRQPERGVAADEADEVTNEGVAWSR